MKLFQPTGHQSYLKQAMVVTIVLFGLTFSVPFIVHSKILFFCLQALATLSFGLTLTQTRFFGRLVNWTNRHQPPLSKTPQERLMVIAPALIILILLSLLGLWLSIQ